MESDIAARRGPRVPPLPLLLAASAVAWALDRFAPVCALVPQSWRPLGWMPLVAGMVLALLAIAQFAQRRTTLQTDRVASSLVSGGVFALSRNPMYLAIMLALSGEAFCLGTLSPWLAPAVMAPLLHCYYIPAEEAMLLEAFGDEYRRYQAKVRRWI